ncbi:MAG: GGDEF domain-containing protein [Thiobacillus sp.]|nr:GGDEF domain-containing protein [Thiobacillus sp.]
MHAGDGVFAHKYFQQKYGFWNVMNRLGLGKKQDKTLKFRTQPGVDKAQLISGEAVNLIYCQSRISMISYLVLVPVMAYFFASDVPSAWTGLWAGLLSSAALIRLLLVRAYLQSDIYAEDIKRWERRFVISLFAVGVLWGLPGFLFTARLGPTDMLFMTMMLFGLSGGSMSAFGHHRPSHAAFTWPLIAPFTLHQLLTGTHEGWLIGFAGLLYLVLTTRIVSGFQRGLYEALATSYERLSSIGELTRVSRQLEQANLSLDEQNDRLAEMNDLFANMLDNSHVMMAYLDRDFRFQFVNEAYAAAGHRPAETFIGQSHFAFYPEADNERIFGEVLATGQPYRADAKPFVHPDQPLRGTTYRDIDLLPVRDAKGEITGLLLSQMDVTDGTQALKQLEVTLADLRQQQDQTQEANRKLNLANEELEFMSTHDNLTGLPNRHYFDAFSTRLWRQAIRREEPIAILMIDVDYFKRYNDHYGHLAGDACLRQIGEVLSQTVNRPEDGVARYGGEEFIAMLSNTGPDGATHLASAILDHVRSANIPHLESEHGIVTLCIGLAVMVPGKGARLEHLVQQADEALYRAKAAGRNRLMQAPGA